MGEEGGTVTIIKSAGGLIIKVSRVSFVTASFSATTPTQPHMNEIVIPKVGNEHF